MASNRQNILFITADQLRADCIFDGPYAEFVKTPNLDRLRASGVTFKRHYCPTAPCGPARASLHTGTYLHNHCTTDNGVPLNDGFTNWAEQLRASGLVSDPCLIGYVDTVPDIIKFDHSTWNWDGGGGAHWDGGYLTGLRRLSDTDDMGTPSWIKTRLADVGLDEADPVFTTEGQWNGYKGTNMWDARRRKDTEAVEHMTVNANTGRGGYTLPALYQSDHSDTRVLVDRAIAFMREKQEQQPSAPWALHLSLLKPHPPWIAPYPYNTLYHPDDVATLLASAQDSTRHDSSVASHPWIRYLVDHIPNPGAHLGASGTAAHVENAKKVEAVCNYFALLTELDDNLGRLFDFLDFDRTTPDTSCAAQETLVVFTCDHGEMLFEHDLVGKLGFFEAAYHIPLIIRDPSREADATRGTECDLFTESVDIAPTLMAWVGHPVVPQFDGCSLLPLIHGSPPSSGLGQWRDAAHWEYDFSSGLDTSDTAVAWMQKYQLSIADCRITVIRQNHFKLIHFGGKALPPLLFDTQADPHETLSLADQPKYMPVLLELTQEMLSWRIKFGGAHTRAQTELKILGDGRIVNPGSRI